MELIRGGAWLWTLAGELQAHPRNHEAVLHHVSDGTAWRGCTACTLISSLMSRCFFPEELSAVSISHFLFISVTDSLCLLHLLVE